MESIIQLLISAIPASNAALQRKCHILGITMSSQDSRIILMDMSVDLLLPALCVTVRIRNIEDIEAFARIGQRVLTSFMISLPRDAMS